VPPLLSDPLPLWYELDSELSGAGVDGAVGTAGVVMSSRASGSCAASGGRELVESIVSRYGSVSPYDSEEGLFC